MTRNASLMSGLITAVALELALLSSGVSADRLEGELPPPLDFTAVDRGGGSVMLSWRHPFDLDSTANYSVFMEPLELPGNGREWGVATDQDRRLKPWVLIDPTSGLEGGEGVRGGMPGVAGIRCRWLVRSEVTGDDGSISVSPFVVSDPIVLSGERVADPFTGTRWAVDTYARLPDRYTSGRNTIEVWRGTDLRDLTTATQVLVGEDPYFDVSRAGPEGVLICRVDLLDSAGTVEGEPFLVVLAPKRRVAFSDREGVAVHLVELRGETPFVADLEDFLRFAQSFGSRSTDSGYNIQADANDDGRVDFSDYVLFARSYGRAAEKVASVR